LRIFGVILSALTRNRGAQRRDRAVGTGRHHDHALDDAVS
jgi:hypothetical protein